MNTDLIGSVELTASAAIVIAALSIGFGSNPLTRFRLAVALGIWFVVILFAAGRLPAPFAPVAGWGDIFVGATAIPVAWLLYRQTTNVRALVWIWNVIGIADPIAAVGLGATSSPGPLRLIFAEPSSAIVTTLPLALDSRLSRPAADYSSHCCLYSLDEAERGLTSDR
jgi:hypothetical protein